MCHRVRGRKTRSTVVVVVLTPSTRSVHYAALWLKVLSFAKPSDHGHHELRVLLPLSRRVRRLNKAGKQQLLTAADINSQGISIVTDIHLN
jgi:hypothetical protein